MVVVLLAAGGYFAVAALTGGSSAPRSTRLLPACVSPSAPPQPSAPHDVHLVVLNGTLTSGLAARVSTQLRHRGFRVSSVGNTAKLASGVATVRYGAGQRLDAQAVADQIAGSTVVAGSARGVELDLGPQFHRLATVSAARSAAQQFVAAEAAAQAGRTTASPSSRPSASASPSATPTCSPTPATRSSVPD